MSEYGDLKTHMLMWSINVTVLKSMRFVQYRFNKCTIHSFFADETVTGMT